MTSMKAVFATLCCFASFSKALPRSQPQGDRHLQARSHPYSPHSASLTRGLSTSPRRSRKRQQSASIIDNAHVRYLLPITIGTQSFDAEIDSGSSDLWIVQQSFSCYESYDDGSQSFINQQTPATCNFGAGYVPDSSYQQIADVYELSCYGGGSNSGRCVQGPLGSTPVEFCGLSVQQTVGAVDTSSYHASGSAEQSGIIGLAFSALTSEITSTGQQNTYSPIMQTIFDSNPSLPQGFSIALSRDTSANGNGGIFTIGGIPALDDPAVNVSSTSYTSAPLQLYAARSTTELSFYAISVDGFVVGDTTDDAGVQVIIDSGAPILDVPQDVADAVNSLWSPAIGSDGSSLDCNAVLTESFGIAIGGATYYLDSADLINQNGDGTCSTAVAGADSEFLLGDPFLKNVLAVYDWGNSQMSFYPRMEYES